MINWQNNVTPIIENNMNKLVQDEMISDMYDNTQTYAVGDYCIYNNTLYRCITAISTAEAFNQSKWEETNVITAIADKVNKLYYQVGDTFTNYIKTGAVTASGLFRFQIPLSKPIASGATPTVTIGNNCKLYQDSVLNMKNYISSISANVLANAIEVTCSLSSTPTGYSANVVTTTDIQCTVTFAEAGRSINVTEGEER